MTFGVQRHVPLRQRHRDLEPCPQAVPGPESENAGTRLRSSQEWENWVHLWRNVKRKVTRSYGRVREKEEGPAEEAAPENSVR